MVLGHDPLLSEREQRALSVEPVALDGLQAVAAIVLQAPHEGYRELDWAAFRGLRAVLDGRSALGGRGGGAGGSRRAVPAGRPGVRVPTIGRI